jgi:hypothetical protein
VSGLLEACAGFDSCTVKSLKWGRRRPFCFGRALEDVIRTSFSRSLSTPASAPFSPKPLRLHPRTAILSDSLCALMLLRLQPILRVRCLRH